MSKTVTLEFTDEEANEIAKWGSIHGTKSVESAIITMCADAVLNDKITNSKYIAIEGFTRSNIFKR